MERKPDNVIWDFDKGKDIKSESPMFEFKCTKCDSEQIDIRPIGISYKTQETNSDLGEVGLFYDSLPDKTQAILQAIHLEHGFLVICNKCKLVESKNMYIDRSKINKWANKKEVITNVEKV